MRASLSLRGDRQRGAVYVEFLLVFPPLFTLFLVILQWSLLSVASLGVRHAASSAVRSAIVVLPDDPIAYEDTPAYEIDLSSSCSEGFVGKLDKLLRKLKVKSAPLPDNGKCSGGPRMSAIRFAAITRMIPFAPNASSILPAGISGLVQGLGAAGWLAGAAIYSYGATSVNFPKEPGSDEMRDTLSFEHTNEPLTVSVTYLAHCGIPIARFFMCDRSYTWLSGHDVGKSRRNEASAAVVEERIKSGRPGLKRLARGVGSHGIFTALLFSGEYFALMSAEATLPMNAAPYEYKDKK